MMNCQVRDFEEEDLVKRDEEIKLFKNDFEVFGLENDDLKLSFLDVRFQMKDLYNVFVVKEIELNVF